MADADAMTLDEARNILGVSLPYSVNSLRQAYLGKVRSCHPDVAKARGLSFDEANEAMIRMNQAYALLRKDALETFGGGTITETEVSLYGMDMTMTADEAEEYIGDNEFEFQTMRDWTAGWYGTTEGKATIDGAHANGYFPNEDVQQGWLDYQYGRSFAERLRWRIATTTPLIVPQAWRYRVADAIIAVHDLLFGKSAS